MARGNNVLNAHCPLGSGLPISCSFRHGVSQSGRRKSIQHERGSPFCTMCAKPEELSRSP